jgi:hypothetical protein
MNQKNHTISSWMNSVFGFKKFEQLIDITGVQKLSDGNIDETQLGQLSEKTSQILNELDSVYTAIKEIDIISEKNGYDSDWISSGKTELTRMLTLIDQLEFNVGILLNHLGSTSSEQTVKVLDNMSKICNKNLLIKKRLQPYQIRLGILRQYLELEEEVLQSVQAELNYCVGKLEEINENKNMVLELGSLKEMSLDDLKEKRKETNLMSSNIKHDGFILFSSIDAQIYESYSTLYESLLPISESLKIIPYALDSLHQNAKEYYSDLVLSTLAKYEDITDKYHKYRKDLQQFRKDYVITRNRDICERVFGLVDEENADTETIEDVVHLIKPIENFYGIDNEYLCRLRAIESKISSIQLEENPPKTPVRPKINTNKSKRSFSNPLADSLNMKPILSSAKSERHEIKIFETPRHIDEKLFSKENMMIVEKIKSEIQQALSDSKAQSSVSATPMSDDSFSSSTSTPDILRAKNIFDSPDPFITPNSRCYQKARSFISTPLTTPRVTPTRKFVMLPIDEDPSLSYQKGMGLSSMKDRELYDTTKQPLLRYELSTVIKADTTIDIDADICNLSEVSDKDTVSPSQIPLRSPNIKSNMPSPVAASRIPLPRRPESRLSMIRSASRLQVSRQESVSRASNRDAPMSRPDSRLENLAISISAKLGTTSPAIPKHVMARPSSVMTQREMRPYERTTQLGRLRGSNPSQLRNIKARGTTSLGTRSISGCSRITSI